MSAVSLNLTDLNDSLSGAFEHLERAMKSLTGLRAADDALDQISCAMDALVGIAEAAGAASSVHAETVPAPAA